MGCTFSPPTSSDKKEENLGVLFFFREKKISFCFFFALFIYFFWKKKQFFWEGLWYCPTCTCCIRSCAKSWFPTSCRFGSSDAIFLSLYNMWFLDVPTVCNVNCLFEFFLGWKKNILTKSKRNFEWLLTTAKCSLVRIIVLIIYKKREKKH